MRGILCRNQNGAQKDFRLEYIKMRSFCLAGKLKVNKATFANCVCVCVGMGVRRNTREQTEIK